MDGALTIPSGGSVFVELVEHDRAGDTFAANERRVGARLQSPRPCPGSIAVGSHTAITPARSGALFDS